MFRSSLKRRSDLLLPTFKYIFDMLPHEPGWCQKTQLRTLMYDELHVHNIKDIESEEEKFNICREETIFTSSNKQFVQVEIPI